MTKRLPSIRLTPEDKNMLAQQGFTIGKPINSGEYGIVYVGTRRNIQQVKAQNDQLPTVSSTEEKETAEIEDKCAAKVIDMNGKIDRKDLKREVFMMNRIKHRHVIQVYDMFRVKPDLLIIFMEFAEGGK